MISEAASGPPGLDSASRLGSMIPQPNVMTSLRV